MKSKLYKEFIGKNVVIRSNLAGVFVGELVEIVGTMCVLKNHRRLWSWAGTKSISVTEIAAYGIDSCKPTAVLETKSIVRDVCEIHICAPGVADKIRAL
jgi:hypothetical protein